MMLGQQSRILNHRVFSKKKQKKHLNMRAVIAFFFLTCNKKNEEKNKTHAHSGKPDPYLVHSSLCTQSTLIRLKAFQPGGDVTAEQ